MNLPCRGCVYREGRRTTAERKLPRGAVDGSRDSPQIEDRVQLVDKLLSRDGRAAISLDGGNRSIGKVQG